MNKLSLLVAALVIQGCATTEIVPVGKDTYMVASEDYVGWTSSSGRTVAAMQRANAYCSQQGKVARLLKNEKQGVMWWTGTSASVIFTCE